MIRYPEHEKFEAREQDRAAVSEFLEWLQGREGNERVGRVRIAEEVRFNLEEIPPQWHPVSEATLSKLIGEWLGVDVEVLEAEKRAMLAALREARA